MTLTPTRSRLCPRCKTGKLMEDTDRDFGRYQYCLACGHQVIPITTEPIPNKYRRI